MGGSGSQAVAYHRLTCEGAVVTINATSEALSHLHVTEVSTDLMASYCRRLFADFRTRMQRIDASAGTSIAPRFARPHQT